VASTPEEAIEKALGLLGIVYSAPCNE
jgi:hypothetical protein